ncbi:adhesion G-protein coupled receptor D1-like [Ruditapes philippinarum]|uniref:adhesion G-protein coupled receptor D1-like n=1 Tax=Ruditapes philippinarum TaxID=129788 RepID=UPI00295AFFDD|nr:adhesion G-protein coupled receptor D1-like [Ruditapes philippinarum]
MKGYGTKHFCWLSVDNGLIWAFVGPALIIILTNAVLLGFVIRAVLNVKKIRQKQTHSKIVAGIRCLCILLPLLGCTWVIGIFYVNESTSWIQYLFSFCNGCQGVVIFIFHCALNKQITNAYEKKRRKSTSFMNLNRSSKPKKTKYLSTSALNLVNSDTGINSSRLSDNDIASNGRNLANITEMKRFEPIKALGEEKPISHEM